MKLLVKNKPKPNLAWALAIAAGMIFVAFGIVMLVNKVVSTTFDSPKELAYSRLYEYYSGKAKPTKTLVVFANNAEQRFGGGFLGSYAILAGNNGNAKLSSVQNIYNIDYDTVNAKLGLPVPEYLKFLAPYLSLRDSGLSHNWPDNAREAMKFYKADTGETVDGVIEITPQVLREMLKKTGPVTLKNYNLTITDTNFLETVQIEVEAGADKKAGKDPKSGILTGLAQVIMSRLSEQNINSLLGYSDFFTSLGQQKNILLYSSDPTIQSQIEDLGLSGGIKKTDYNYLQITEANFGADKSSPFVNQKVTYDQTLAKDGSSTAAVSITRQHTRPQSFPYVNPYTNKPDYLIKNNISYMQILVPESAKLQSYSGIDKVESSFEKPIQELSYISLLAPQGPSQTTSLIYSLPQHYNLSNTLSVNTLIQKQSGGWPYDLTYKLHIPVGYHLAATNLENTTNLDNMTTQVRVTINQDTIISLVYEKD